MIKSILDNQKKEWFKNDYTALLRESHINPINNEDTDFQKVQANSKNTNNKNDHSHSPFKDTSKANTKNQSTNQRRSKEQRNAEAIAYRGRSIAPSSKNSTSCTSSPLQMKNFKHRDNSTTGYKENTNEIDVHRIVGITNPNLDCFLNSALQCIFCVPEFVNFFVNRQFLFKEQEGDEYKQSKTMKLPGYKYCEAMHKLCYSLAWEELDPIKNTAIRHLVKDEFPLRTQNDAMQFILHIFDKLQQEQVPKKNRFISRDYDDAKEAWEGYMEKFPTITDQLFTGMYQKNVHCKGCGNVNKVFENFNYIWLGLEADNLEHAYNNYVQDTTVYEPGSLKCKACRERPETVITKEIIKLPQYCIFLFNRFDYENDCKNNKFINYPETLDLSDMYDRNMTYELLSISIHSGGLHGGHYTAVGKKGGTWVKFNDSITRIIRKSQAQDEQAYVLFYKAS